MELIAEDVHCAQHHHFVESCAVCKRARANFLPYPVREQKPLPRSFGYTDHISEQKLKLDSGSDGEFNLSLAAINLLLRLIWPFGKIRR